MCAETSASGFGVLPSYAYATTALLVSGTVRAVPGDLFTELVFLVNCGVGAVEKCLLA